MTQEFSKKPHIYLITNLLNGKQYVGQTNGKKPLYFCSGLIINKAIKSKGKSNFSRKILIEGDFTSQELNDLELQFMQEYNTLIPNGYNISQNGRGVIQYGNIPWNKGGGNYSTETREKMSLAKKGKKLTEKTKFKISSIHKGKPKNYTPEQLEHISSLKRLEIIEYSKEGIFQKNWGSITEAATFYKQGTTKISQCCLGKQKTVSNLIFRYKTENFPLYIEVDLTAKTRPIEQITILNEIIIHKNTKEARKWLKVHCPELELISDNQVETNIRRCCREGIRYKKNKYKFLNN